MQPETRFKNKIRPRLDAIPSSFWVKIQQVALRGIPDFLGVINGQFIALELKIGDNKASKLQEYRLDCIRRAGGFAEVLTPDTLDDVLKRLGDFCHVVIIPEKASSTDASKGTTKRSQVGRRKRA